MWPTRAARQKKLAAGLLHFSQTDTRLQGIADDASLDALAWQMIASLRRLEFTSILRRRQLDPSRQDPCTDRFDPETAAILHYRQGNFDEAIWLIFLATHFGKHRTTGWKRLRDVYSGLGSGIWTWERICNNPASFCDWLAGHWSEVGGAFGNHRKYETLDPNSRSGTAYVFSSFVAATAPSPSAYFAQLARVTGNDPHSIFDAAYRDLQIHRFGRLAKFDFLALIGRLDLAPLTPGSAYLQGATGPLRGARLLVDGDPTSATSARNLDAILKRLDVLLNVGMQVMEDSICNWQKSPRRFVHFRG